MVENDKDTVSVTKNGFLINNLRKINELSYFIECDLSFKYFIDSQYKYFTLHFYDNKTITAIDGQPNNGTDLGEVIMVCSNTLTTFSFSSRYGNVEIRVSNTDKVIIDGNEYNVSYRTFKVRNLTDFTYMDGGVQRKKISDLNKCIYNYTKDGNIYPYYVTSKYIQEDTMNYYGDLQTYEDYFFYNDSVDYYNGKIIRIFSRSENETALFLEFNQYRLIEIVYCLNSY